MENSKKEVERSDITHTFFLSIPSEQLAIGAIGAELFSIMAHPQINF